jgi:hypothetical protein
VAATGTVTVTTPGGLLLATLLPSFSGVVLDALELLLKDQDDFLVLVNNNNKDIISDIII